MSHKIPTVRSPARKWVGEFYTSSKRLTIAVMAFIYVPDVDNDNMHVINSAHIVRTTIWKKGERAHVHLSDGVSIECTRKSLRPSITNFSKRSSRLRTRRRGPRCLLPQPLLLAIVEANPPANFICRSLPAAARSSRVRMQTAGDQGRRRLPCHASPWP